MFFFKLLYDLSFCLSSTLTLVVLVTLNHQDKDCLLREFKHHGQSCVKSRSFINVEFATTTTTQSTMFLIMLLVVFSCICV